MASQAAGEAATSSAKSRPRPPPRALWEKRNRPVRGLGGRCSETLGAYARRAAGSGANNHRRRVGSGWRPQAGPPRRADRATASKATTSSNSAPSPTVAHVTVIEGTHAIVLAATDYDPAVGRPRRRHSAQRRYGRSCSRSVPTDAHRRRLERADRPSPTRRGSPSDPRWRWHGGPYDVGARVAYGVRMSRPQAARSSEATVQRICWVSAVASVSHLAYALGKAERCTLWAATVSSNDSQLGTRCRAR